MGRTSSMYLLKAMYALYKLATRELWRREKGLEKEAI